MRTPDNPLFSRKVTRRQIVMVASGAVGVSLLGYGLTSGLSHPPGGSVVEPGAAPSPAEKKAFAPVATHTPGGYRPVGGGVAMQPEAGATLGPPKPAVPASPRPNPNTEWMDEVRKQNEQYSTERRAGASIDSLQKKAAEHTIRGAELLERTAVARGRVPDVTVIDSRTIESGGEKLDLRGSGYTVGTSIVRALMIGITSPRGIDGKLRELGRIVEFQQGDTVPFANPQELAWLAVYSESLRRSGKGFPDR